MPVKNIIVLIIFIIIVWILDADVDLRDIYLLPSVFLSPCPLSDMDLDESENKKLVRIPSNLMYNGQYKPAITAVSDDNRLIPRIIFQTNKSSDVPYRMFNAMKSWMDNNPNYQYFYFDDGDIDNFIKSNYNHRTYIAYTLIRAGAYRADFFRLCVILKYGGVYIDSSHFTMEDLPNLDTIIKPTDSIVLVHDTPAKIIAKCNGIYNAFIAATPNHPIIKKVLDDIVERLYVCDYGNSQLYTTGPCGIGKSISEMLSPDALLYHSEVYNRPELFNGTMRTYRLHHGIKCNIRVVLSEKNEVLWYCYYPGYHSDRSWYHDSSNYTARYREGTAFICPNK